MPHVVQDDVCSFGIHSIAFVSPFCFLVVRRSILKIKESAKPLLTQLSGVLLSGYRFS